MIYDVLLFFSDFLNMGLIRDYSRLKRDPGWGTPLPASHPIFIFFRKYENRRNKYRNTDGTERDFFRRFHPYPPARPYMRCAWHAGNTRLCRSTEQQKRNRQHGRAHDDHLEKPAVSAAMCRDGKGSCNLI